MIQEFSTWLSSLQEQKKLRSGSDFRCLMDVQNKVFTQHPEVTGCESLGWCDIWKTALDRGNIESLWGIRRSASHSLGTQVFFDKKNASKNKEHNALPSFFPPVHCIFLSPWWPCEPWPVTGGSADKNQQRGPVLSVIWFYLYIFWWQIPCLAFHECCLNLSSNQSQEMRSVISSFSDMRKLKTLGSYERVTAILTGRPSLHW